MTTAAAQDSTTEALAGVDACIHEANVEFCNDLEHHLQWLEKQKPGASAAFMSTIASSYALNVVGLLERVTKSR